LTAHNIAFQPTTLCAPAGQALTIAFDNQDSGVPHNVQIFSDADMTRSVFKGDIFSGPETRDYQVPALPAGVYRFRCDVHPQMTGVLVVASA
jgi:plastocyanin